MESKISETVEGSSVLITGGGAGLGRALVERFINEGAVVTVLDRSEGRLRELEARYGDSIRTAVGDVTSPRSNVEAVEAAVSAFGGLDTLIANAGLWDFSRPLADMTIDEVDRGYRELFDVNVKGYLLAARAAIEELQKSHGSIIFTLSNAALYPMGGGALYTASKHAGLGLVRQLAFEFAPTVRVNAVAPGGMATELTGPVALDLADRSISAMPIRDYLARFSALELAPEPEDYVAAYVLLASRRDARITTGAVLDISSVGTPQKPALNGAVG
ncbi:3-(cis-5,6-dihydroxycyclohexa-1,3-dien-1-yl)propanoate dehydrogenase [Sphaerisporangium sp. NPDC051011]|uniref:3-(cis-5,6-dihydroxycyclohexa-1, 3-dien-1-yl)propanoate dehydrogenase n=1 Tax=Sphaerisporangium sp. NPDC051011 TaxID=3155792 RepID=UPI0033D6AE79